MIIFSASIQRLEVAWVYTLLPIFTLLLWAVFSKSASLWQQLPAFMLGSAGAVLLLWIVRPAGVNGWYWNWGDALFFLTTLMLAAHVVLMQKQSESVPSMVGTFLVLACGSVLLTPFVFLHPGSLPGPSQGQYWLLILWLAIFTTLVTVLLQQFLVKRVGSSHFIAYSYLIPVLVAVMAGTLNSSNIVLSIPGLIMIIMALAKITGFSKNLNARNLAEVRKHCGSI